MSNDIEEKAPRKYRTQADKDCEKRVQNLAFRLALAAELIGQVWRDADYEQDIKDLRELERLLIARAEALRYSAS